MIRTVASSSEIARTGKRRLPRCEPNTPPVTAAAAKKTPNDGMECFAVKYPPSAPMKKQQKRREKDSTASAGEARQKSEARSNTDRHWTRRRRSVGRVAAASNQAHRREKQQHSNQDSQDRSRRLHVTAEIRGWN